MKKILVIDDDEALRGLFRRRLSSEYEVFETGEPEQALAMALEHKPDAILLDLKMPKFDGFELCRNFRSLTYTANLPLFVVTGESGRFRAECESIGITGYFEKPIDFMRLRQALATALSSTETQQPRSVRSLRMRVCLKLQADDQGTGLFSEVVFTDSVSPDGFEFTCERDIPQGRSMHVFLTGNSGRCVGYATVVGRSAASLKLHTYRAVFEGPTDWILQRA